MMEIRIIDDLSATEEKVVRMICDCGWEEKTFRRGSVPMCVDHFTAKHGGTGRLFHKGLSRDVRYGLVQVHEPHQSL